jgi:hypothetical protein
MGAIEERLTQGIEVPIVFEDIAFVPHVDLC